YGNPVESIIYFRTITSHVNADKSECVECGNVNPEQIFNILEAMVVDEFGNFTEHRKISSEQWYDFYKEKISIPESKKVEEIPQSTLNIPNKIQQLGVFITRDVLSKISNVQYMAINFSEAPLLAFILAFLVRYFSVDESDINNFYVFSDNENLVAYLFMSIIVALFMGLTVSAEEIIRDSKILRRESFLNLSKSSYLFSKLIILFTISAIQMFTYVVLGNYILDIHGMTFDYWLVIFSTACFANMLGLNISATFDSAVTIYILIPILLIPQLLLSGVIVKFDKLNPSIAADTHVPLAGDLMTSKWAFEALAVNQFKNNKYEQQFFKFDKKMSRADYQKNYLIPKLLGKVDFCMNHYQSSEDSVLVKVEKNLLTLRNELVKLSYKHPRFPFNGIDRLTSESFNGGLADSTRSYLNTLKKLYIRLYNKANLEKDILVSSMQDNPEKKMEFIKLKKENYNVELSSLVRNSRDPNKIIERNQQLIRKTEPIFLNPINIANLLDFRAHFFAPQKQFLGRLYNTFGFNVAVIWTMCLILYITLYFNVLRRILNLGSTLIDFIKDKIGATKEES
ncbi:MAG: ABC transporter permease, partial [Bacteroidetes bacterium]|nr:ABC transporter permease [Bacteroidota bacterium]